MAVLDDLPAELVEHLVHFLTLHEVCALRLASRSIASKASQDHFRSFYRSKRVDVDERGLKDFVVVTANAGMGCLIDEFTLTGLVYNSLYITSQLRSGNVRQTTEVSDGGHIKNGWRSTTADERDALQRQLNTLQRRQEAQLHFLQSEDAQRLLVKAFRNIVKGRSSQKPPLSLTLDLSVFREDALIRSAPADGGSWRLIWQAAADTFRLVEDALDASMLPVHELRVFPAYGKSAQKRCSLACDEISPVIKYSGLESCLARLKTLTLTFSDKSLRRDDRDAELMSIYDKQELARQRHGDPQTHNLATILKAQDTANFSSLLSFVTACHNLERLDLHRYCLTKGAGSTGNVQGDKISHLLFQRLTLPHLRDCSLRGFRAGSDDTVTFLRRHRLHKLLLKNFALSSGTFRVIFDHCTGDGNIPTAQPDLERIEFENLFQEQMTALPGPLGTAMREACVVFEGPDLEHDSDIGGLDGNNTMIQRWRTGTKRPIWYSTSAQAGRPVHGSLTAWRDRKRNQMKEFGPPDWTP